MIEQAYNGQIPAPSREESAPFAATLYNPASAEYRQQVWLTEGQAGKTNVKPLTQNRPPQISQKDWEMACANAPHDYEPTGCLGAHGLVERKASLQAEAQNINTQLDMLKAVMQNLNDRQAIANQKGLQLKRHMLQHRRQRIWRIMQKLEILRAYQQSLTDEERLAHKHAYALASQTHAMDQAPPPPAEVPVGLTRLDDGDFSGDPAEFRVRIAEHRSNLVDMLNATKQDLRDVKLLLEYLKKK